MGNLRWPISIILMIILVLIGCSKREVVIKDQQNRKNEFIIAGSGSNLPITGKLVELYNQKHNTEIQLPKSIGSNGGINAIKEGAIDIGLISRPLKEREVKDGLKQLAYIRIGVIIGSNFDVTDNNISFQDLVEIYLGKKTKWQNGKMIIVLSREEGDSSNRVLEKEVPGFEKALKDSLDSRRWHTYFTDLDMNNAIMKTTSSIGLTDTGAIKASKLRIKALKINGVEATMDNVANGTYKLYKDLYFVYKEPLSDRAKKFINFVYSKEGAKCIANNGGIPLKGK